MEQIKQDIHLLEQVKASGISQIVELFHEHDIWAEERRKQLIADIYKLQIEDDSQGQQSSPKRSRPKRTAQIKAQIKIKKQKKNMKGKLRRPTEEDLLEDEMHLEKELQSCIKKYSIADSVFLEARGGFSPVASADINPDQDTSSVISTENDCAIVPVLPNAVVLLDDDLDKMPPPTKMPKGKGSRSTRTPRLKNVRVTNGNQENLSEANQETSHTTSSTVEVNTTPSSIVHKGSTGKEKRVGVKPSIAIPESTVAATIVKIKNERISFANSPEDISIDNATNHYPAKSSIGMLEDQSITRAGSSLRNNPNITDILSSDISIRNVVNVEAIKGERLSNLPYAAIETMVEENRISGSHTTHIEPEKEKSSDETVESVYEDALATRPNENTLPTQMIHEELDHKFNLRLTVNMGVRGKNIQEMSIDQNVHTEIEPLPAQIKKELVESNAVQPLCTFDETFDIISVPSLNETVTVVRTKTALTVQDIPPYTNTAAPRITTLLTNDSPDEKIETLDRPAVPFKSRMEDQALFSPSSPVRNRVKAFEKALNTPKPKTPAPPQGRLTRTKTRAMKNNIESKENSDSLSVKNVGTTSSTSKLPRTKLFTPQSALRVVKPLSSMVKKGPAHKAFGSSGNISNIFTDANTGVKPIASKGALNRNDAHKKQTQKEDEAIKKKNAIIQAVTEEKMAKREEKARMVHEAKVARDRERELAQQQAREKEEKHMQMQAEREEKMREEAKLVQKKRELEELERLKQRRLAEDVSEIQRMTKAKLDQKQRLQKHLMQKKMQQNVQANSPFKVPAVAMANGFQHLYSDDSTDDEDKPEKVPRPEWSSSKSRKCLLPTQSILSSMSIDTFFWMRPITPNLALIFPGIDPKKLKRRSSAVWRTPPRYSQIPKH